MVVHNEKSPLAGKTVKIKEATIQLGGKEILIEDWWDRLNEATWKEQASSNWASKNYASRLEFANFLGHDIPVDDEVVYGKIDNLGYIVHIKELENVG